MRYLATSLLLAMLVSCALKTTEGLREQKVPATEIKNPYFSNASLDYVYKAKLNVYGRHFGGILVIKKLGEKQHRVVFTTEFGNRIFDFSYDEDVFTTNFVIAQLDKKLIVNILKRDFRLLIKEHITAISKYESDSSTIYKSRDGNRFNFYKFAREDGRLQSIVHATKNKEKIICSFQGTTHVAKHIKITHQNMKLNISLIKFDNQ